MSYETDDTLDEIAAKLNESGEAVVQFELGGGQSLEEVAGFFTALAELEDFDAPPRDVVVTLRR
jgi:hypothetical protein